MSRPPALPRLLGFAGLLPALAAFVVQVAGDPATLFMAQALLFAYAALIFSFLGGMWWGLAARAEAAPAWLWFAAVAPSLVALAACWPWAGGAAWPGPSLVVLGIGILGSLVVDRAIVALDLAPDWWMRLRIPLSIGLGGIALAAGLLA